MPEAVKKTDAPEAENRSAAKSQAIDQQLHDGDRDSLHTLPLALLPLNKPSLLRAKMLKDNHMRTVVEMFTSGSGASGRMEVEALEKKSTPPMNSRKTWPSLNRWKTAQLRCLQFAH